MDKVLKDRLDRMERQIDAGNDTTGIILVSFLLSIVVSFIISGIVLSDANDEPYQKITFGDRVCAGDGFYSGQCGKVIGEDNQKCWDLGYLVDLDNDGEKVICEKYLYLED